MIDKWFLEDIGHLIKKRKRVVILDPKAQCGFLLPLFETKDYILLKTESSLTEQWQTVKEELFMRHEAETEHKEDNVVFYVTRGQDKISFLFDYCFTHGCLDLSNPAEWLKKKLFATTGLQIQMDNTLLLTAGKMSMGKDIAWWKKKLQNLEELVNLEDELIPFLHDPERYLYNKEPDIISLFEERLFQLLGQPYMMKPPKTLADEVAKKLLDGLAHNDINEILLRVYYRWSDSEHYSTSLVDYISAYKLGNSIDPWTAHPDHCFRKLDHKALRQLVHNIKDKKYLSGKLNHLKSRSKNTKAKRFVPLWWQDVIILLDFNSSALTACNSFNKVVEYYTDSFSKVDRAIRNLYAEFMQEEAIIRPLQEYYESLNYELLQIWFEHTSDYKSNQQGYLVSLFNKAKPGLAVIVGDGIRYEIADHVAESLRKKFKIKKQIMLAGMPSETEHNMSALYLCNNDVLPIHKDREKKLTETTGKEIVYKNLEALSYGEKSDYLVLTYKDIDSAGEKLHLGAIKLFGEFEQILKDKITQLLNIGYEEVHLITDHGFVLTGLLDEADKIAPDASGKKEVHERFIRTVDKQVNPNWVGFEDHYDEYEHVYAAKSHRPFKSKGKYGFSHGGFTPQEIIIPEFIFRKEKSLASGLEVGVVNKVELADVTGEIFVIKLQATSKSINLFSLKRKVQILLYIGNKLFSRSNIINMEPEKIESMEFSFHGNTEFKAVLLDAETQEQLDIVTVKKSNVRDLGGLL